MSLQSRNCPDVYKSTKGVFISTENVQKQLGGRPERETEQPFTGTK
jgi:hypothetical protein